MFNNTIRYSFEQLSAEIQKCIVNSYSEENKEITKDNLGWNWYDAEGNIISDMLPY